MTKQKENTKDILMFSQINLDYLPLVGGKNASLGELISTPGIKVPDGFAITTVAHQEFMKSVRAQVKKILSHCDYDKASSLQKTSDEIRHLIEAENLSAAFQKEILESYGRINHTRGVAVRSSATSEDLPNASFAGQQDTFLNVSGEEDLFDKIKKCFSSLYTARAISYRKDMGISEDDIHMSVAVQEMVRADRGGVSGVMFTTDTESGNPNVILITPAKGLGEAIVQGEVTTDEVYVLKHNCRVIQNPHHVMEDKEFSLLAKYAMIIEKHYRKRYKNENLYMDIEWAKDGETGEIFILQARPETIHSQMLNYERYYFTEDISDAKILASGRPVGEKIGSGTANVLDSVSQIDSFQKGQVLVTNMTDPDWEPIMKIAGAIVTNQGGRTCHAAIVARELGIPCIVGAENATHNIKTGDAVTVSCVQGEQGRVYEGKLKFKVEKINVDDLPRTKTKVMLNVGTPGMAFSAARLPNDGVGLARTEFIVSSHIHSHPMYLIKLGKQEEFIHKLSRGVSKIAAAFYPKDVIVRFSDFKSNEYANLLGGKDFEPHEENPMFGWRGASRYYDENYREAFAAECTAMKRVIEDYGLDNIKVMVPFVRTVDEAKKVRSIIDKSGLKCDVYMMAEIPSNAILIEEFLEYFDGVSIGSNDLTQTTLGLDRDSAHINHIYDERNAAVKFLIERIIRGCKGKNKKVGICGQAPSDFPDFSEFLVHCGIDSISVTPDVAVKTKMIVSDYEGARKIPTERKKVIADGVIE